MSPLNGKAAAAVVTGLENMNWPAQCTLTSKAIKSAQIEMINSRKGVPSVVIVLTDGFPYSNDHTRDNARDLKESGARLMMVPCVNNPWAFQLTD